MKTWNKTVAWVVVAFVLATIFVVSALAMNRGNHIAVLTNAAKEAAVVSTPLSGEPKPSAGVGVIVRPAGAKSKRARAAQRR
jgi:hypothetical protein